MVGEGEWPVLKEAFRTLRHPADSQSSCNRLVFLHGSKQGLLGFVEMLRDYGSQGCVPSAPDAAYGRLGCEATRGRLIGILVLEPKRGMSRLRLVYCCRRNGPTRCIDVRSSVGQAPACVSARRGSAASHRDRKGAISGGLLRQPVGEGALGRQAGACPTPWWSKSLAGRSLHGGGAATAHPFA